MGRVGQDLVAPAPCSADHHAKIAVITGATGPIGRATAHRLWSDGFGLALIGRRAPVLDQLAAELAKDSEQPVLPLVGDLAETGVAARLIADAERELGRIDVLVNNAGGWSGSQLGSFSEKSEADIRTELDNNLLVAVLSCRAALPVMVRQHFGRIINISSVAGIIGLDGHSAYSAAKAGHTGLARQLAMEFGSSGITANCVAPGPVQTPAVDQLVREGHPAIKKMLAETPTGRLTTTAEVAHVVSFLASPASGQISGQVIAVDGGMTAT